MTSTRRPWSSDAALEVLADVTGPGTVLVALQTVQEAFGYVPAEAVPLIAEHANVSRSEVHGVLTYYRDLRTSAPPDVEIQVCLGEACQAVGARQLMADVELTASKQHEVRHVYCLGNCALGPAAMINDELIGRASTQSILARAGAAGAR